ncbi:hypothetical protein [Flagellimonas allohymeniacidonis]|uniref:Uncharacterized protein n=1 Tax=Flagellimonas allohymeniacidonis TaxID=2517819 RepID=A0A4Q8Q9K0_9FLAO|nr:hypothetical protein [Allomuricauda hymeniacidonis]TAI46891.1 hypothetical protein EW142_09320 [Allomuricauda hymeniacidonis]
MEKLDKYIKKKLEERRIHPSEEAWNKIGGSLPVHNRPNRSRKYIWAIAASFIGVLFLSVWLSRENQGVDIPVEVVNKEKPQKKTIPEKNSIADLEKEEISNLPHEEQPKSQLEGVFDQDPLVEVTDNVDQPNAMVKQPLKDSVVEAPVDVISLKAEEVLAQVELLERTKAIEVTDAEVDSLLRTAQKELLATNLFNKKGKVDAMVLLTEVEDELDGSFRDQIFDALKEGYLKLRTAVADRNK